MKFKEIVKPALILFVICLLTAAALAGTNFLTKDRISQQEIENAKLVFEIEREDGKIRSSSLFFLAILAIKNIDEKIALYAFTSLFLP